MTERYEQISQSAVWPGAVAVENCTYTCSHGITPGTAFLSYIPQPDPKTGRPTEPMVGQFGDLVFSDGVRTLRVRGCKVVRVTCSVASDGITYHLEIVDRRWRWVSSHGARFGGIHGRYNRVDTRGKLVPWSIRSPYQLAKICLDAMGERNYEIRLPNGLRRSAGENIDRYLRLGENFLRTATNPEMNWDHTPPAQCLSELADIFNCRVIYRPHSDTVLVAPLGEGEPLPDGAVESFTPSVTVPEAPAKIGVVGSPIKWQAKFLLEAVGEDWDGMIVPINQLSYGPTSSGTTQVTTLTAAAAGGWPWLEVSLTWTDATGKTVTATKLSFNDNLSGAQRIREVVFDLKDRPAVAAVIEFAVGGSVAVFTGKEPGFAFTVGVQTAHVQETDNPDAYVVATTRQAKPPGVNWSNCIPPHFAGVNPTDRLSYQEAIGLAQKSVWRYYRVRMVDPDDPTKPLNLPLVGEIKRRQQVELLDAKVEQVEPRPRIAGGFNAGQALPGDPYAILNQGVLPEFYTGFSRDAQPTVHGSVSAYLEGGSVVWFNPDRLNTSPGDRVYVPFRVWNHPTTGDQLVDFSSPVYRWVSAGGALGFDFGFYEEPTLVLECACVVRDYETDAHLRYEQTLTLPGGMAETEWHQHPDLQIGIIVSQIASAKAGTPPTITITYTGENEATVAGLRVSLHWKHAGNGYDPTFEDITVERSLALRLHHMKELMTANADVARDWDVTVGGRVLTLRGKLPFPASCNATDGLIVVGTPPWVVNVVQAGAGKDENAPAWFYAPGDIEHAVPAGTYYLHGHRRRYLLTGGSTRRYIGIIPIDLDGRRQQVSYSIGPGGATTTASENTEHSHNIPSYPARRRFELLSVDRAARAANMSERAAVEAFRRPAGAVK